MGLGDALEGIALIVVLASLSVGFWESSQEIGELTVILDKAVEEPTTFGGGFAIFTISLDTWTPGIPVEMLPSWLQWISMFYWFAEGYLPHFSIWTCVFALIFAAIVTFILLHVTDWEFFWNGFFVGVISFVLGWYGFHLITWWGIGFGADLMGLGSAQAYNIWRSAVAATRAPLLQYFFLASIPLSLLIIYRKIGERLV